MTSHYSRTDNPSKRFLNPNLNVSRMFQLYLEKEEPEVVKREKEIIKARQERRFPLPQNIKSVVSKHRYYEIFNSDFNLGFGLPRTDTCATCDRLSLAIKSDPSDTVSQRQLADHQDQAEKGYQTMRGDKKAAVASWSGRTRSLGLAAHNSVDAVDMISFDFQQNLPTPNLHHNDMFYARQLWTYNFGIHDCIAEKGYMYMWDETVAKRGSSEVASCLNHFFRSYHTGARSLVSFSDGCGGQNKNLTIIGLYNELHLGGVYKILNHKFLTRGHTFLRNDSDFAQIEKRKASAMVYLPSDWFSVVKEANRRNPFEVVAMQQEKFLNFKDFVSGKYTNRRISAGGSTFHDIHWLNFGWGEEVNPVTGKLSLVHHPEEVWMRCTYSDREPWKKVKIVKERPTHVPLEPKYADPLVLKAAKVQDLKKMARHYIPSPHCNFYLEMVDQNGDEAETEHEDSD